MTDLSKINVNGHTEKKNGLTYLSWAWAWAEVLKVDPNATWEAVEFNGLPCAFFPDKTAMVKTVVTISGVTKSCWLPVMDHKNKAIPNPDSFAINKAIVRCMTKAVSMFGLGLYIYAGEDMPEEDAPDAEANLNQTQIATITGLIDEVGADFEGLMSWISKGAGRTISSLKETPADAYSPIMRQLEKKRVATA